ncbi:MAG: asparagine synthase-related protein [Candidatus Parvarchaeota archaeon]|nr:asparagine synthase-related protein [Candidatus Parvarchaeota archaeon]MCW1301555.1 asparagine synthase-related protein [Candidatus Parvarchaeota archaeon]
MEELKTDLVNSNSRFKKFGKFSFVFPGNSMVRLGDGIQVHRLDFPHLEVADLKRSVKESLCSSIGVADAVLLSGGIDSSVIAKLEYDVNKHVKFISCGFAGSHDLIYANILAKQLNADIINVNLSEDIVVDTMKTLKGLGFTGYDLILGIVEYNCLKKMSDLNLKTALTGMGSDELLFGYDKYKYLDRHSLIDYRLDRVSYISVTDGFRINKLAKLFKVNVLSPYLDTEFVRLAMNYDITGEKYEDMSGKKVLRMIADEIGIDKRIVNREKKAMQYGSGVLPALRAISKARGFKGVNELANAL